jgi:hypothetical protein
MWLAVAGGVVAGEKVLVNLRAYGRVGFAEYADAVGAEGFETGEFLMIGQSFGEIIGVTDKHSFVRKPAVGFLESIGDEVDRRIAGLEGHAPLEDAESVLLARLAFEGYIRQLA